MTEVEPAFNLLEEPWIEVQSCDGSTRTLSIVEVFRQSPDLTRVVGDLPTQGFAILRLLLAILRRAVDGPPDESAWEDLEVGLPPMARIEAYCERYRDRFYLFHPTTPFFQVADLHTQKDEFSELNKLIADVPAGRPYFSMRVGPGLESLTAAEAARWVVHAQAFDASGIKSGAVGDERVSGGKGYPIGTGWAGALGGVYVEGESLWRTLLLNTIPLTESIVAADSRDRPAWEAEPDGPAQADMTGRPFGPLDLFTWQSRRIRLVGGPEQVTEVLIANGDKLAPPYLWEREPMTGWRRSLPQQKKLKLELVYMPKEHQPERAFWRGLESSLPAAAPRSRAVGGADYVAPAVFDWAARMLSTRSGGALVNLRAVGMVYGTQSAVVVDVIDDGLLVSPVLLQAEGSALPTLAVDAVKAAEAAVLALRNLASNLVKAGGGSDARLSDGARERASERAYAALDAPFRDWIAGLGQDSDVEGSRIDWHRTVYTIMRMIGMDLIATAGDAAWVGREVSMGRDTKRLLTAPLADLWFQAALIKALPVPANTTTDAPPLVGTTKETSA